MKRPILLAIVGDSGSGRSTIASGVIKILGRRGVTPINLDDYHRYDRIQRQRMGLTALDPACNHIDVMYEHLVALRNGQPVIKPIYNHRTGRIEGSETVIAQQLVVVQGLFALSNQALIDLFDLSLFLDPNERLRQHWKLLRDITFRGYEAEDVLLQIKRRQADLEHYIRPQRAHADLVVCFSPLENEPLDHGSDHLNAQLIMRQRRMPLDLMAVLEQAAAYSSSLHLSRSIYDADGHIADLLEIAGSLSPDEAAQIEDLLWPLLKGAPHLLPEQIGSFTEGQRTLHSDPLAIIHLIVSAQLAAVTLKG